MSENGFETVPAENEVNVKWEHFGTFRRFLSPIRGDDGFASLRKKCEQLVNTTEFDLAWKDDEGDAIVIATNCDLEMALRYMKNDILRLLSIKKIDNKEKQEPRKEEGAVHPGVTCDLCDKIIIGTRFKCITCADYDLCAECERTNAHIHHAMIRIVDPDVTIVPWGSRLRARAPHCFRNWQKHHEARHQRRSERGEHSGSNSSPFAHPNLFDDWKAKFETGEKMSENRFETVPAENEVNVKWEHFGTFRRFLSPIRGDEGFANLRKKCEQLVNSTEFDLAWKDDEGDAIVIATNCDLEMALRYMKNDILRLLSIKMIDNKEKQEPRKEEGAVHPEVTCDLCDKIIIGTRFKCITCADYDLCAECERTNAHIHHAMIRIVDPDVTIVPWGSRLRARAPHCFRNWQKHHEARHQRRSERGEHSGSNSSPFTHPNLFDDWKAKFETGEVPEQLKSTCKNGIEMLNTVGQQLQQALANFGIDATYEVRPPAGEAPKPAETEKKETQEEQPMEQEKTRPREAEKPMETEEPIQAPEPVVTEAPQTQIPVIGGAAIPMPPPPPHPQSFLPSHFPPMPNFPYFTHPQPTAPAPAAPPTASPMAPPTAAQAPAQVQAQTAPSNIPSNQQAARVTPVLEGSLIDYTEENDWVMGDVYPRQAQNVPNREMYHTLLRMGFDNRTGHVTEAVRKFPGDINAAIDFLYRSS